LDTSWMRHGGERIHEARQIESGLHQHSRRVPAKKVRRSDNAEDLEEAQRWPANQIACDLGARCGLTLV
jgi:hypothetical protein